MTEAHSVFTKVGPIDTLVRHTGRPSTPFALSSCQGRCVWTLQRVEGPTADFLRRSRKAARSSRCMCPPVTVSIGPTAAGLAKTYQRNLSRPSPACLAPFVIQSDHYSNANRSGQPRHPHRSQASHQLSFRNPAERILPWQYNIFSDGPPALPRHWDTDLRRIDRDLNERRSSRLHECPIQQC